MEDSVLFFVLEACFILCCDFRDKDWVWGWVLENPSTEAKRSACRVLPGPQADKVRWAGGEEGWSVSEGPGESAGRRAVLPGKFPDEMGGVAEAELVADFGNAQTIFLQEHAGPVQALLSQQGVDRGAEELAEAPAQLVGIDPDLPPEFVKGGRIVQVAGQDFSRLVNALDVAGGDPAVLLGVFFLRNVVELPDDQFRALVFQKQSPVDAVIGAGVDLVQNDSDMAGHFAQKQTRLPVGSFQRRSQFTGHQILFFAEKSPQPIGWDVDAESAEVLPARHFRSENAPRCVENAGLARFDGQGAGGMLGVADMSAAGPRKAEGEHQGEAGYGILDLQGGDVRKIDEHHFEG